MLPAPSVLDSGGSFAWLGASRGHGNGCWGGCLAPGVATSVPASYRNVLCFLRGTRVERR